MDYPIVDESHPLYAEQQNGWPNYTAQEAWAEAYKQASSAKADSRDHPAYAANFIRNDQQQREAADAAQQEPSERPGSDQTAERR